MKKLKLNKETIANLDKIRGGDMVKTYTVAPAEQSLDIRGCGGSGASCDGTCPSGQSCTVPDACYTYTQSAFCM
jgi:hypothetical protein